MAGKLFNWADMARVARATYKDVPYWSSGTPKQLERTEKEWSGMIESLMLWSNTLPNAVANIREASSRGSPLRGEFAEFLDEAATLVISQMAGINNALRLGGPAFVGRIYLKRMTEYRRLVNEMIDLVYQEVQDGESPD